MNNSERRFNSRVDEIGEHLLDLIGDQHALVDDGIRREASHVEEMFFGQRYLRDRSSHEFSDYIQLSLEAHPCFGSGVASASYEKLSNHWLAALCGVPEV